MKPIQQHPVGWFPFWILPVSAGIISSFGILATYFVALKEGHIEPFPYTDITHAAIKYPEYIIFRSCLIVGAIQIGIVFAIVAWWIQVQAQLAKVLPTGLPFITYAGWVAAFLLCLSTASISDGGDMNWTVHVIGATGFFAVTLIILGVISKNYRTIYKANASFVPKSSYLVKMILNTIMIALGLIFLYSKINSSMPHWVGDAVEWVLTLVVITYVGSFALDLYNVQGQLADTEEIEDETQEESQGDDASQIVQGEQIEQDSSNMQVLTVLSAGAPTYFNPNTMQYFQVAPTVQ